MINKYKIIYINDDAFCFDSDSLKILKINGKKVIFHKNFKILNLKKQHLMMNFILQSAADWCSF